MPGNKAPFTWVSLANAADKTSMMISIYPEDATTAILSATANTIEIEAKGQSWASLGDWNKPNQPGKATDPKSMGASYMAVGAASALVFASMF